MNRYFMYLRQYADIDSLPLSKRLKALSFSSAITALEGLPTSEDIESDLTAWAKGKISFADFYLPILKAYRILETENYSIRAKEES